ncbi:Mitochondrial glycoprotein superfamily [Arabidopsis thaliana x Arabidopsis arenosa]|uniref:Mitochondrial glycoprotein family protein n=4 Tax=Arabidopsis TaxID=3701 RepID=A0A1P8AZU6_ARATH|nr:Mitochondrial glycoprotein family protein [Arabidopsis thaliana]ANM62176.1 Mitochondrial glycoprotein family protein [Arabidopsis thaliana]KAG7639345.1 Mitochondrial glycoprotein superfamily [Arabidopsis thaliana x Arabidopsis arenosa]|eukprot:NP_001324354.1 Mitochondrial glycoprotein family protein [Arabidopsis thaliana]
MIQSTLVFVLRRLREANFREKREMRKLNPLLKRGLKAIENGDLLKILQSEIRHEISHPRFQGVETGSLGDFKLDWDSPESQDIVLKRQFDSGEKVVVSALLQPEPIELEDDLVFPREAHAKVCIKKPGLSSILQFHCRVYESGSGSSHFDIESAYFIRSFVSAPSSTYGDHFFSQVDPKLHSALEQYLISKGVSEGLTNFLLCHLNKKEQDQYVNWLRRLESTMSHSPKP